MKYYVFSKNKKFLVNTFVVLYFQYRKKTASREAKEIQTSETNFKRNQYFLGLISLSSSPFHRRKAKHS